MSRLEGRKRFLMRYDEDGVMKLPAPPTGAEPVWRWAAESRPHTLFGKTGRRVPHRRALCLPGLRAAIDGRQSHQEVCAPLPAPQAAPFLFILKHKRQRIHSERLKTQDFFSVLLWYKVRRERVLIIIFQVISSFQLHSWTLSSFAWFTAQQYFCYLNG